MMLQKPKTLIGWKEWCAFPDLRLPAIKAKVDTGAKTSCIHAYDIQPFMQNETEFLRFKIHPLQHDLLEIECSAPVSDHRNVTSSNGEREKRYVIKTPLILNEKTIQAEVTLTSRHQMTFRMLLGRDAISKAKLTVDPARSFMLGKLSRPETLYDL